MYLKYQRTLSYQKEFVCHKYSINKDLIQNKANESEQNVKNVKKNSTPKKQPI